MARASAATNGRPRGWSLPLALLWGFAEATVFMIVPDVLLTWLALHGTRPALIACLLALLGALAGGALMWTWGRLDVATAQRVLDVVPAISPELIAEVRDEVSERGATAVLLGPLAGRPYKVYAVESGGQGIGLPGFLAVSIPARLSRFVLLVVVTGLIARVARPRASLRTLRRIHLAVWMIFYALFFLLMPS